MKKKIGMISCSLLLVLALVLVLLPGLQTEAEAAAATSITVNGYDLPSGYYLPTATWVKTTTKPSGSYFYYYNGTLTAYNVTLTGASGTRAIYAEGDLIVSLSGTNKLTTTNANGIRSTGTLKFTGSGSLTVNSSGYDAIYSSGNMEFAQTGTVTTTATGATSSGVETAGKLTIGGNLTATSESNYAIYASGDISMTKGTVNATGNCTYSTGGICSNGAITISGGTLNVTSKSDGIISKYDFWQKAGNVTVNADWNGIVVETATNNAIIHEGVMTVTAVRDGLKAQKFYMNGGRGYIKSTNTSSDSSYYAVKLAGNTSTYFSMKGNVKASGSTTTSSGGLTSLTYANLPTYDYVFFTGYITVNGVELRDGQYLSSGGTSAISGKPTTGGYATYSGNTLTLNNYEGSSTSASGIYSRYDLNIVLAQGSVNKLTTAVAAGTTYCGINVSGTLSISGLGQLNISGGKYAVYSTSSMTLSNTQVIAIGGGIYSGSALKFTNASVGVYQLLSAAAGTHAIQAAGDVNIDGAAGVVYINSPDKVDGSYIRGIVGKNITINSPMGITSSGVGIRGEGNVTIKGGTVEVNAKLGSGIYAAGTMTISGGTVDVTAYNNGLAANKIVVTGGQITAVSTYTGDDAANKAIDVPGNTTTYFQIPSTSAFLASTNTTSSYNVGNLSNLATYDWVRIGDFVYLHDVELPSGYYLESGNSTATITTVMPSSGEYAYYEDGVLTLRYYEYSGNSVAIRAFADLTVESLGGSSINHIISHAGDLTFMGSGVLDIKRNMANDAVNVAGDVYVKSGRITIDGSGGNGIDCKHFYLNGGKVWLDAYFNGINVDTGLTVNGGALIATSTATTNDTLYSAINSTATAPTITIKSGLNHMVGRTASPDDGLSTSFTEGDYDFVAVGDLVMVRNAILTLGDYIRNGSSTPALSGGADNYAYYSSSNRLILKNYQFSGNEDGIVSSVNLTISLDGANKLDVGSKSVSGNVIYCDAIRVAGDLTIEGYTSATESLTAKSQNGYAIYVDGKLTVKGESITATSGNAWVVSVGAFSLTGGTLNVTSTTTSTDSFAYAMRGVNSLNVSGGTLNVTAPKTNGISVNKGSMTVSGGVVNVTSPGGNGIVIDVGNLTVSGGELNVSALYHGVELKQARVNVSDGFLTLSSTNTASDSSYCALKLAGTSSDYYNVASAMSQGACLGSTKIDLDKLSASYLNSYDYVQIGKYIEIGDVTVKNGWSINGSGNLVQGNGGAGYAYYVSQYAGNTLTLNGYSYSGASKNVGCINAFTDLTIHVTGNSTITTGGYIGIQVVGNVTFTGTKQLAIKSDNYSLHATGNVTFNGGDMDYNSTDSTALFASGNVTLTKGKVYLNSSVGSALFTEKDLTISAGSLIAFAYQYGIYADNVSVTGGNLVANSSNTTNDSTYRAVRADSFTCASGLYVAASTGSDTGAIAIYDSAKRNEYDYIYVGDYVIVNGVLIPNGYYLAQGSVVPTAAVNASSYVYYSNGKLTMSNFTYSGESAGIQAPGDLEVITGGVNNLTATNDNGIYIVGDLTITGPGSLEVSGTRNGVCADQFIQKSGKFTAISKNTDINADYKALDVSSVDLSGISDYALIANYDPTSEKAKPYESFERLSYHYVSFEPFYIKVNGIEMGDGDYLLPGAGSTIGTLPSGTSAYAQRVGNKLNLVNYTCAGGLNGIECNGSLNLVVAGTNSFSSDGSYGIKVGLDLDISGSGELTITDKYNNIYCGHDFNLSDTVLNITSIRTGIYVGNGNFTMNSGELNIDAQYDGINAVSVTFNGGTALIKSGEQSHDGSFAAIWADDIILDSGLIAYASVYSSGTAEGELNADELTTYDYIRIETRPEINLRFTKQPAGGEVPAGEKLSVNWELNFTPVKLFIDKYDAAGDTSVAMGLVTNITSVQLAVNPYGYRIRAYYNDTGWIASTRFYVTEAEIVVTPPTITLKTPTLLLEDTIKLNIYYTIDQDIPLEKMGMITWKEKPSVVDISTADAVYPGATFNEGNGQYGVNTDGIPAQNLGDIIYFCIYAELADGSIAYGKQVQYSPTTYAYNQLKGGATAEMKALLVAILNYGAAAQTYLEDTDPLVTSDMTDAMKALIEEYRADMVHSVAMPSASKQDAMAANGGFSAKKPTIALDGAFSINYYFTPSATVKGNMTFYYWNAEDFAKANVLSTSNATGSMVMTEENGVYGTAIQGIAAKDIDSALYACGVYTDANGNTYSTGILPYSLGFYCGNQAKGEGALADLAAAIAVYGYYAGIYFAK